MAERRSTARASPGAAARGRTTAPTRSCSAPSPGELLGDRVRRRRDQVEPGDAPRRRALQLPHALVPRRWRRKKGFEIASYEDDAEAVLDGKRFTSATLRPTVALGGRPARPRGDRGAPPPLPRALLHRQLGRVPGRGGAGVSAELPLSDVRVLDLTRLLPGGFCSLLLADLGAEVLKVEDTGMGDYIRWAPPYYGEDADQELGHPLGALPRPQPRQALGPARPQVRRRARGAAAPGGALRRRPRRLPPRCPRPARGRLRADARGEPGDRRLRDHRLRPGRPQRRARRPRHELPRAGRAARPDRRQGRAAGPVRRARSPTSAAAP